MSLLFKVSRTSQWSDDLKPIDECFKGSYIKYDIRTLSSFEEYDKRFKDNFKDKGFDHKINKEGHIQRAFIGKGWFIELEDLEDLKNIYEKYGEIIFRSCWSNENIAEIEIYDVYRE